MFVSNDDCPTHNVDYPFVLPITDEKVWGLRIKRRNIVCWYVNTMSISNYTPSTMPIAGGMISGNLRSGLTFENHQDFYNFVPHVDEYRPIVDPQLLFDFASDLPKTKITQFHHLHVNKYELKACYEKFLETGSPQHRLAVNEVINALFLVHETHGLSNRVSFITHVMYALVAPIFAVYHLLWMLRVTSNYQEYMDMLKNESGAAKQSQTVFRNDLAVLYELQVLFNRVSAEVDWEKEKQNRVESKTVPIPAEVVYQNATWIFKSGLSEGRKPMNIKWGDYWNTRWSSMPNGSIVSQYDADLAIKSALPREAKLKSCWFACTPEGEHSYWLKRHPEIYATTSTKYEWGKVRALYGCDVTSFLHADFAMSNCEDTLPSCFPVGKFATDSNVKSSVHKFKDTVPVCFDYDDFNSQHSIASMQAVMRAWIDCYKPYLSEEQYQSAEWTHDSLECMSVRFNATGETVAINGTLMSGWRLTSYMNTVLNRVYLMHAKLDSLMVYSLHNGDDMYGGAPNLSNAIQLIRNAKEIGIRAQVSKTNLGTIGEFLRVDTRASDSKMSQYLARAVSTLVHGRVETGLPFDLASYLQASLVRVEEVRSRGGSDPVLDTLMEQFKRFSSELFKVDPEIVDCILNTHPVQGGICKEAPIREKNVKRLTRVHRDDSYYFQKYSFLESGINSYITAVKDKLRLREEELDRKQLLLKAYTSLERDLIRYETGFETDVRITIYRGLYGAWKGSGYEAPIAKARSMGLIVAKQLRTLSSTPAELIKNAKDPVKFMSVIF